MQKRLKEIKKWVNEKVDKKVESYKYGGQRAQPPLLEDPRPRPLSPSPPIKCLQQQNALFGKVPYDIRRIILVYAFGKRRLHVDLCFDHPDTPLTPDEPGENYHCGVAYDKPEWDRILRRRNHAEPKSWQWWSSICHRHRPDSLWIWQQLDLSGQAWGPWLDNCRQGNAKHCHSWPGDLPSKCQVGIMGWLLSCRQA